MEADNHICNTLDCGCGLGVHNVDKVDPREYKNITMHKYINQENVKYNIRIKKNVTKLWFACTLHLVHFDCLRSLKAIHSRFGMINHSQG